MKCNSSRRIRKGEPGYGKKKFVVKACEGGTEKLFAMVMQTWRLNATPLHVESLSEHVIIVKTPDQNLKHVIVHARSGKI